jgi:ribosomal protein S18 acetylase RimI-like enzyme
MEKKAEQEAAKAAGLSQRLAEDIFLRAMAEADREPVREMFREHLEALGYTLDPAWDADMDNPVTAYAGPGNQFVVAVDGAGQILGMCGLKDGEIRRLYVRSSRRGRGVAGRLVRDLVAYHEACSQGILQAVVARDNTAAQAVFQRCGFVRSRRKLPGPPTAHCELWEKGAAPAGK